MQKHLFRKAKMNLGKEERQMICRERLLKSIQAVHAAVVSYVNCLCEEIDEQEREMLFSSGTNWLTPFIVLYEILDPKISSREQRIPIQIFGRVRHNFHRFNFSLPKYEVPLFHFYFIFIYGSHPLNNPYSKAIS
jgi:hypothetical protein